MVLHPENARTELLGLWRTEILEEVSETKIGTVRGKKEKSEEKGNEKYISLIIIQAGFSLVREAVVGVGEVGGGVSKSTIVQLYAFDIQV